jgi:ElaB/YqjD/DUF883 family membrane-anchored ribosome-binding protein
MSNEFQMQQEERPGEREEKERLRREREEWEKRVSEAATSAKDYVSDKVSVLSDKIKDLQNADLGELAENAKDYARRKPGQALLISAGVGFLLGLLIRGRR